MKVKHARRYFPFAALLTLPAFCWLWSSGTAPAQAQEPQVAIEPRVATGTQGTASRAIPSIRVDSDLVLIPVLVTDRNDRTVTGLEREHFRLWEDKVEQTITHFAADDVPVSIVLAFDTSGSMGNKLKLSRAAVDQFIKTANPEDEFSLVAFNDQPRLLQKFTKHGEDIQTRMLFLQSKGRTALLDAIVLALNEMRSAKHSRKAILIVSDGGDNSSRYGLREVRSRIREADVQIYAVGIEEPLLTRARSMEEFGGAALLQDISSQTGGRLYEIDDVNELPSVAAKIGMSLRNEYVLGYVPATQRRDGKYHKVQVKIERPLGVPPLRASFRTGYIAPGN
jgi:VWFA-related protein